MSQPSERVFHGFFGSSQLALAFAFSVFISEGFAVTRDFVPVGKWPEKKDPGRQLSQTLADSGMSSACRMGRN